jgi:hypothetical protein
MKPYVLPFHQLWIGAAECEKVDLETARIHATSDLSAIEILSVDVGAIGPTVEENSMSHHPPTLHTIRLSIEIRKEGCFSVLLCLSRDFTTDFLPSVLTRARGQTALPGPG